MAREIFVLGAFVLLAYAWSRAGFGGGGGGGNGHGPPPQRPPSKKEVYASAGPEVFASFGDAGMAVQSGLLSGVTYADKPAGWSLLDWEDYLAGN